MLSCAGLAAVTALTSLRYLPGRVAPGRANACRASSGGANSGRASSGGPNSGRANPGGATPAAPTPAGRPPAAGLLGRPTVVRRPGVGGRRDHPLARPRRPVRDDERVTEPTDPEPDWRQRKKAATRDRIRGCALRLFLEQGYDATTVEQIAAAAGVSHMTFFRYFPAKEDVVLSDSYDPLIARLLEQTPAAWPLLQRIRAALLQGLAQVYETDRDTLLAQNKLIAATPALRDRLWADQIATQQLFLQALGGQALESGEREHRPSLQTRVTVAACLAAASTAILAWVENDGTPELPELIDQAFETLARPGNPLSPPNVQVADKAWPRSVHANEFDFVSRATISRGIVGCLLIDNILWAVRR